MIATVPTTAQATESSIGRRWRPPVASPSISAARPTPDRTKPATSSGGRSGSRMFSRIEAREHDPEKPDRDVDEEDPAPVEIGRDEAAERRADHRPDHGGHGQIGERRDDLGLRNAAQEHEPADRHHHGPAHALEEARRDEAAERARSRAGERAGHEHRERRPEHGARAEAIGHPAADGDEDREADEIGGQRELQRDRVLVQVFRRSPAARSR